MYNDATGVCGLRTNDCFLKSHKYGAEVNNKRLMATRVFVCYPKGFLSFSSNDFSLVQHTFSSTWDGGSSWVVYCYLNAHHLCVTNVIGRDTLGITISIRT